MDAFFRIVAESYPGHPSLAYDVCLDLYSQKKLQFFTSIAGLLLRPEVVFRKLPTAVLRMNTYNSYKFALDATKITYTRGNLVQVYEDPELRELNSRICEAARGSITGILKFLGYHLIDLTEKTCVARGDQQCEYEISWANRSIHKRVVALGGMGVLAAVDHFLFKRPWMVSAWNIALLGSAVFATLAYLRIRANLHEAFEYQSEALEDLRKSALANHHLNNSLLRYQEQLTETLSIAAVGEMSYSFIHDMSTPTQLLMYYSAQLASSIQGKDRNENELLQYTTAIENATERLLKLQAVFRTMVKQKSDTVTIENDLNQAVRNSVDLFGPFLEKKGIKIDVVCPESPVRVSVFEGSIEAILLNLMQNALNAMLAMNDDRAMQLTISLSADSQGSVLSVADTGKGIPPQRMKELWQPFGPSGSSSGGVRGTGFGLYSIKKLLDRLGGKIEVESSERGTTFLIRLPVISDEVPEEKLAS